MPDISELEWANEAFAAFPEATNLWIGGDESVTSFHKASPQTFVLLIQLHGDGIGKQLERGNGRQTVEVALQPVFRD